jgi:hypothetical protein
MKLDTKKFLALLFVFIFTAETFVAFARKHHTVSKFHKYQTTRITLSKSEQSKTINTKNSFFSFAIGFVESLGGNETGWYECLPQGWTKESKDDPAKNSPLDQKFEGLHSVLKFLLGGLAKIVDGLCKVKSLVFGVFKKLMGGESISFVEVKSRKRRGGPKKLGDKIKKGFEKAGDKIKEAGGKAIEKVKEVGIKIKGIAEDVIKKIGETVMKGITALKEKFIAFKEKLKDLFKSDLMEKLKKLIECIKSAGKFAQNIMAVIKGFYTKINSLLVGAAAGGVGAIVPAVDIIIGLICNWRQFKTAIDYFILAYQKSDKIEKMYFVGKGFGQIAHAIGTAETVTPGRRRYRLKRY